MVLLNIMLFLTFTIPAVQKRAADFAIQKLKPKLNTEVTIDKVRIKFFNAVELGGLYVEDQKQDTLLYIGELSAGINIRNLLNNKLNIRSVRLNNLTANINKENPEDPFNFQFLIDAFAPQDTTPKPPGKPLDIAIRNVKIFNGTLRYNILSQPQTPGQFNAGHFEVYNFNLQADVPSLDMKNLKAELINLTLFESQSGINITELRGEFRSQESRLHTNEFNLAFNNSALRVYDASFDTASKEFAATVKSDNVDPADVSIFAPMLSHLDKPLNLETSVNGNIPLIGINNLTLNYGNSTHISLAGTIEDVTNIFDSDIDINIEQMKASERDIEAFIRIGPKDFDNVQQMVALEFFDLNLALKGTFSNFNFSTNIKTEPGDISFKGRGSMKDQFSDLSFSGLIQTSNLKVAKIIGESIGADNLYLVADAGVEIKRDKPLRAYADGNIGSIKFKDYIYEDIHINGVYSGSDIVALVESRTEENEFTVDADLSFGESMKFNVDAVIDKLKLSPLIQIEQWNNPFLTTRINTELEGASMDELAGLVVLDSTSLHDDNFIYNPGPIYVQALAANANGDKKIEIFSSIIEGEVVGDYHFTTIGNEISALLNKTLPSVIGQPTAATISEERNIFDFNFILKNTEDLSYALSLPFINVDNATLSGSVNMKNGDGLALNARVPRLMMGQNDVRETRLTVDLKKAGELNIGADTYLVQDNGHINAKLRSSASDDHLGNVISFAVDNSTAKADGSLDISFDFMKDEENELLSYIYVNPTHMMFNDKRIDVIPSEILYEKDRVEINDFELREEQMLLLGIDGIASRLREDSIRVFFNNTDLGTILTTLKIGGVNGSINGGLVIHQAFESPIVHTDNFRIENLSTQKDTIGTLILEGNWDNLRNGLMVDADLKNKGNNYLCVNGFIPLGGDEQMDVGIDITELPLRWIQPFAVSTFSNLSGTVNSEIKVSGKLDTPQASGWLGVDEGIMTVAFTNVTYKISDTINISPDRIGLDNLVITDNNNNEALLNVSLEHSNFDGMSYNVNLHLKDFLLMNNERRIDEIAYGTLKLSGDINLTGSSSGLYGTANLRNESKSKLMIELPQTAQATEYSGIIYINTPKQYADSLSFLQKNPGSGSLNTRLTSGMPISIQATLDLNPQLEAGVEINPTTGDALEIKGRGKIRANIDTRSEPMVRLYGDYIAEGGKFHYNFQNLKSIDFNISSGSTVTLVGDPLSTQFDITAYNQVTADLTTLSETFSVEASKTRIPVNAKLDIQGSLNQMNVNYGIDVPDATSDIRQRMNSLISTDEQKNKQFASLILTGSFMPAEGIMDVGKGGNVATSLAIGQLAKGLDAIFASAFDDNWSINTSLQSTDGTFENIRMGVDVSTRLFDDKLRLTTNLSYGDNSTLATQQDFMGEFELEYDLNSWLMLRAYNRANQRFSKRAPTTQGAGVVVTKNSFRFKDLFRFSFRKRDNER